MKLIRIFLLLPIIFISNLCFASQIPIGSFDVAATGTNACYGWAIDPDSPWSAVTIHFYIDGPAGQGQFLGTAVANGYRPDVNSGTGYPGNHGFNFTIPSTHNQGYRKIYAYAINIGGGSNPLLSNNYKTIGSPPSANSTISKWAGVSNIVIKTNTRVAGAIYSLKWYGKEFINNYDHGRQMQSASMFYFGNFLAPASGECFNPTEAGSSADWTGSSSTSSLQALSAGGSVLQTQTQMAFYGGVGVAGRTASCSSLPAQWQHQNAQVLSNHILKKKVTIGTPTIAHAIKYETEFVIPNDESYNGGQFEVNAIYLHSSFNKFLGYNPITEASISYNSSNAPGEQGTYLPIAYANATYAIGIFTEDYGSLASPMIGYGMQYWNTTSSTGKINLVRRIPNINANSTHKFISYVIVGSLDNVKVAMRQLYSTLVSPLNLNGRAESGSNADDALSERLDIEGGETSILAVQNSKTEMVTVYGFNFQLSTGHQLKIYDVMGRELQIRFDKDDDQIFNMNASGLSPGIYYIRANTGNQIVSSKVLIQR